MNRTLIGGLIVIAIAAVLCVTGCSGDSNDWTWYDAEYVAAQVSEEVTCVTGLQGNHYGWDDPQPDHGNDGEHGHQGCRKHGKHDCEEQPEAPECDVETYTTPAYFILRNTHAATLYVNAEDLMAVRPDLTECGGLVALHVFDPENPNIEFYPFFLFDVFGNFDYVRYFRWLGIE